MVSLAVIALYSITTKPPPMFRVTHLLNNMFHSKKDSKWATISIPVDFNNKAVV